MPEVGPLHMAISREAQSPGLARRALRDWCPADIDADLLDDAELLVSELVTNALRHGRGGVELHAALDDNRLFVEVVDEGTGFERTLRRSEFDQVGGWGLEIVEELASRWGVHEGTTHVWFELERAGPRLGEPERPPDV